MTNALLPMKNLITLCFALTFVIISCTPDRSAISGDIPAQAKPWTRWWWMGNILDSSDITTQMEAFASAGLGGVEITPIFGVKGYEEEFFDHLSRPWQEMVGHTLDEAERLGLGVDMNMGTGWPFGGPQVESEFAASILEVNTYNLKADKGFEQEIVPQDEDHRELVMLQHLFYFEKGGMRVDLMPALTGKVLSFVPDRDATLYAVFCVKTGQQVKRAAPGGEGYTLDHFSREAFDDYVEPYDTALSAFDGRLRAMFNDSYEVYGADYTKGFMEEFRDRRQYDLQDHLPVLLERSDSAIYQRILCDYRETLSDLIIEDFAQPWDRWSGDHGFLTKYQAHGSPGNLVDLYAAADIPECEIFGSPEFAIPGYRRDSGNIRKGDDDRMMQKFCSSAAHLKGDELVSSETFTWLREHFKTSLAHCKPVADEMLLSGVNHIFLHGSTYSPPDDPWPGFKFYASVNFNPTNAIWRDAPYLFGYIGRCQQILQEAETDNEVLLYWPFHDVLSSAGKENLLLQLSVHNVDEWLVNTSFYRLAHMLDSLGIGFDILSDRFLMETKPGDHGVSVAGWSEYRTILVPELQALPLASLKKLLELHDEGADIVFAGLPKTVPGFYRYAEREVELHELLEAADPEVTPPEAIGDRLLSSGMRAERDVIASGLKMLRKKFDGNPVYFLANHTDRLVNRYIAFRSKAGSALLYDPMSGTKGYGALRPHGDSTGVRIRLLPGQSLFVFLEHHRAGKEQWPYTVDDPAMKIDETGWKVEFVDGGPNLPEPLALDDAGPWTGHGEPYDAFAGTARYSTTFTVGPLAADGYFLELEDIRESARVYMNDQFVGAIISHPYRLDVTDQVREGENRLEIEVTNLSSNRLRALERSGTEWKKFYEINMVNIYYQPFDASGWEVMPSGINGEVLLIPAYR